MESNVSRFRSKINRLLEKLDGGVCETRIEKCLDKLLALLSQQEAKEVESALIMLPICAEWLGKAVATWSATGATPPTGITSFVLNLASLLSKKEERFCDLNSNNFCIKLLNALRARHFGVARSVKLAYIDLLLSFLEHKSGVSWMIAYDFWEDVFRFNLTDQDEVVTKKSALFMSKILEETVTYKESFCDDVVKRIMSPLNNNINRSIKASSDLDDLGDDAASLHLKPTVKLIGDVLQYFLDGILFDQKDYRVVLVFLKNFHLEETICDLMVVAQSKCLVFDLGKIMFIMQFLDLYIKFVTSVITAVELSSTVCKIKHNFISSVSKGSWEDFIKFCNFGLFYWKLIETKIPIVHVKKTNEFLPFSYQFLVLTILPQVCLVMKYCTSISEFEEENLRDDFRNVFIQKLFRMMSYQETVRTCYSWRDRLIAHPDLFRISKYSVSIVKESTRYYSSDEAVVIFQALIYILKDVLSAVKESPHKLDLFLNQTDYFFLALEIVTSLINEFDITWRNSFEAFDVMALAFDFLTVSNWSTQVIVQALKLIDVATAKCMAPSLALLLDLTADSTTVLLGPRLYAKLLDGVGEVKKAALEVICTMANMSNYKPHENIDASGFYCDKMESIVSRYQYKINRLVGKLVESKCGILIEVYLNKLLTILRQQESKEVESALIALPIFAEWLGKAVTTWNATRVTPPTGVASFAMNVASLLSKNEERFCSLNNNNFFIKLVNVVKARQNGVAPSVKLGYIKLLSSFLEHKSGIEWMIACNFWENVFQFSLTDQDERVTKESAMFMSKLLETTIDCDEDFCNEVVKRIMLPLGENIYRSIKASMDLGDVNDEVASQHLRPTLKLIGDVLQYFLEVMLCGKKDYQVALVFLKKFHLEERISDFMIIAQSKCLVFDVGKIMFMMQFLELYIKFVTNSVPVVNLNASVGRIKNNFILNMRKGSGEDFVKFSNFGLFYWKLMETQIPTVQIRTTNESLPFSYQFLIFMMFPQYCLLLKYCMSISQLEEELLRDDFRDVFVQKLFNSMNTDTIRVGYAWRDRFVARSDMFQIAKCAATIARDSRIYYSRKEAVMVFQIQVYSLKDLMGAIKESPEKLEIFLNEMDYFSLLFENVTVLINEFDITWKDSWEAIDVMAIAFDFLMMPNWSTEIVVQILKLINVATAKYMAPNLALLLDSRADWTTALLGPLLYSKLLDEAVEVKEAALEVIRTMAKMSNSKFESALIALPIFAEWLRTAVTTWSAAKVTPPTGVASFTMNLAGLLSKNEETFCSLNSNNFFIKLVNVLKARQNGVVPCVKLAYIKLLSSFLEHKSGTELMIACNFWENVFQFSLTDQDDHLRKESTMFMSKLLETTIDCDEDFCDEIVKRIMLPLGENVYRSIKASTDLDHVSEEVASQHLKPTLKLIGDILQYFLDAMLFGQEDYRVTLLFLKNFLQEERISDFMMMAQLKCLVFDVRKVMFIMRFLELYVKFVTNSLSTDSIDATVCGVKRDFILNVSKCNHEDSISFCDFGQFYWRLIETKIPMTRISKTECFPLSNQFVILMLMPHCCITLKYCRTMQDLEQSLLNDEFRNIFIQKLFKITCQDMIRLCYTWRDNLIGRSDLFKIGRHSMGLLKHHRQYYSRDQAVILFQMFIYIFKDMIDSIKESPDKLDIFLAEMDYLNSIFEILNSILSEFEITWKDSFETIDVMSVAFDFLTLPNWSERVVAQLLKLVNVATAKNMAPNLALLVDSTANSTVGLLGPVLYTRLLDEVVEVKEAALEVVCTMAKMSNSSIADQNSLVCVLNTDKMESDVARYQLKIKRLLEKFLWVKCPTKISEQIQKLLSLLRQQEEAEVESTMMTLPILAQWVRYAVTVWTVKGVTPAAEIAAFAMDSASLLSTDEKRFGDLNCNNFFTKLVNVVTARQAEAVPAVKLAYVKWLASLLEHKSGVKMLTVCNFWEDVLELSLTAKDVRVKKESIRFLSKLLDKTIDPNESFAKEVVTRIIAPLGEDDQSDDHFGPTLKLIGDILDYFLEGILFRQKSFRVVFVFLENFQMEENIAKYKVASQSKSLAYDLGKVMFVMQFLELYFNVIGNKLTGDSIDTSVTKMKINFISKVCKCDDIAVAMKFCRFSHTYWSLIESKIPLKKNTKKSNPLGNQLIILELIPIFCIVKSFSITRSEMRMLMQNEFRDYFLEKLQRMSCHDVFRACYIWRDYYLARPDLLKICACCIHQFKESRKYYSRDGAVVIFQALIYSLKDFIHSIKEQPRRLEGALDDLEYFWQLFDVLAVYIEDFRITWRDGFEAVDVVTECFDFLMLASWPDRVVVEALKLMNVATAKYMSPNLALLVDTTTDSIVALLGPLLYAKLCGQTAQVKKAALEVICTMARMSNCKFPSLQKVLMDSELPTLVVKMSTCDGESFVRATAIKCLQEMIQVEEIWNNALKSEDLSQKMRDILFNETEGIVRVEAATFMCVAYENQQFPKDALEGVYETMIYSSTTDLHWEVKVRALGFWDQVIKNHLQNQGMIDGSFPNVTFSKEHRKIVTLTDSEIRKRLLKVLSQLSSIGCLGVLMSAIKDDCDMEVSKTAVKITQRLVELFKNYNVRSDCSTPTSPLPTENGMSATASVSSGISADETMVDSPASSHPDLNEEIIEQIVNSKDVCLLKNVYAPSDYGSVNNYDIQVRKIVTPNEFLQFTQQDLNSIIADKKNWLNGIEDLGSLLDDMLKTYDDDVNKMDCY